jgi:tetratricopeptide (TPR) repeat protein
MGVAMADKVTALSVALAGVAAACASNAPPPAEHPGPVTAPVVAAPVVAASGAEAPALPAPLDTAHLIQRAWKFDDPRASELEFRELAREAGERGDVTAALELETQVARAQGLDGRMPEARSTLGGVEGKLEGQPSVVRVRLLLEKGRVFNSSGAPAEGRPLFEQAWELARTERLDGLAVDAAHMVAITLLDQPNEAIAWNEKALALARSSTQPLARKWLPSLLNNQGWSYFEKRDYEQALGLFEEALELTSRQSNAEATRIAKWSVGKALRALGELERALEIQRALLAEVNAIEEPDGFVFEELGECYLAAGDSERAKENFAKAYAELAKVEHFAREEPKRLERIGRLGGVL